MRVTRMVTHLLPRSLLVAHCLCASATLLILGLAYGAYEHLDAAQRVVDTLERVPVDARLIGLLRPLSMVDSHQVSATAGVEPSASTQTLCAIAITTVIVIVVEGAELGTGLVAERVTRRGHQLLLESAQQVQRVQLPFTTDRECVIACVGHVALEVLQHNTQLMHSRRGQRMQLVQPDKEVTCQVAEALLVVFPAALEAEIVRGAIQDQSPIPILAGHIEGLRFGAQLQLEDAIDGHIRVLATLANLRILRRQLTR